MIKDKILAVFTGIVGLVLAWYTYYTANIVPDIVRGAYEVVGYGIGVAGVIIGIVGFVVFHEIYKRQKKQEDEY